VFFSPSKSSFVTVVDDDVVSEPSTKETSHEPSIDQMTPLSYRAKESVVELPHVQVDFVYIRLLKPLRM